MGKWEVSVSLIATLRVEAVLVGLATVRFGLDEDTWDALQGLCRGVGRTEKEVFQDALAYMVGVGNILLAEQETGEEFPGASALERADRLLDGPPTPQGMADAGRELDAGERQSEQGQWLLEKAAKAERRYTAHPDLWARLLAGVFQAAEAGTLET